MENSRKFKRKRFKITPKPENSRKFKRKDLIYYLKVTDQETNQVIGHVVNISNKGLMLIGEDYINPGATFQLQMYLPEEIQGVRNYEFTATSRWCKEDEKPDFYNTGFELNNVSSEAIEIIKHLVLRFCY